MSNPTLLGRRVLLIIGGGIAAYKSLELVRLIKKSGGEVMTLLTKAGAEFVTPMSLAALSGHPVRQDLFMPEDETAMGHIELSRWADLVVVAPATAGLIAKAANGMADDLASTTLLATDKKTLWAPAMNVRMWEHPAVQANVSKLKSFDGFHRGAFVGPDQGEMACGEFGFGRMAEPAAILDAIAAALSDSKPLAGRKAVITAGPTFEAIDPVRGLTNRSSGKQGYAVAAALAELGAEVTLVSGPVFLNPPAGVRRIPVEAATEMLAAGKIKKVPGGGPPALQLIENPDILAAVSKSGPSRPKLVIGFAAETSDLEANAKAKLSRKGCDWIVGNDVSQDVFGSDGNAVTLFTRDGSESWARQSKTDIANRLAQHIVEHFKANPQ